jgi:superfamily I DNA/RNA helicase
MEFRIADTFTDSLGRLTGDEQASAKMTAFDLQLNPANPGMQFHQLDRAKDKNFWSIRVKARVGEGMTPHEIAVFVRSDAQLPRARDAVSKAGLKAVVFDANTDVLPGSVSLCTMHRAKGLEFRAVVVAACDDEIVPLQSRIEAVSDDADLEEVYNTERHLLYVACTRARDMLLITGVAPASKFLDDLRR